MGGWSTLATNRHVNAWPLVQRPRDATKTTVATPKSPSTAAAVRRPRLLGVLGARRAPITTQTTHAATATRESLCLEPVRPNVTPARALMARDFYCDPNAGFTLKLPRSHSLSRDPAPPRKVLRRTAAPSTRPVRAPPCRYVVRHPPPGRRARGATP